MKKTYIEPSVEVVNVNAESMVCASIKKGADYDGTSDVEIEERLFDGNSLDNLLPF